MSDIANELRERSLRAEQEGEPLALLDDAADEIERLREERLWISVEERLPQEYETVLVVTDGKVSAGEIRFPDKECGMTEPWWMVFKDRRNRSVSWAGMVSFSDVTHWMPLPEMQR